MSDFRKSVEEIFECKYENILAFDIEVFQYQSSVVFRNLDGDIVRIFTDNAAGLGEYVDKGYIQEIGYKNLGKYLKDKTLIAYNNYYYDNYILYAMIMDFGSDIIKQWNDSIIKDGSRINMKKVDFKTFDVFQQIDVAKPSLKKIEGNLGHSIKETDVDFDIDRVLTAEENRLNIKYNAYDVLETIQVLKMRLDYFESKKKVIKMLPEHLQEKAVQWNTTSIIGQLLKPTKHVRSGRLVSDELMQKVNIDAQTMWKELDTTQDYKFKRKKVLTEEFDCVVEFGWGGLHGAPKRVFEARDVKLLDVNSMYPNILILFDGLGDMTDKYKDILDYRLKLKKEGKKKEQAPYKLILNSTYGLLNNKYSQINKPSLAFSICIYGQIAVYTLSKMLHEVGCKVFNINTDGVAFVPDIEGKYKKVWEDWEKEFRLNLSLDEFDYWIQKDVNNYIAVTKDGKIKTKGADVNKYLDYEKGGTNYYFKNADTRIIQKALVDKIVYNKDISETITENIDNPILYQYVLQAGGTYLGTFDNKGKKLQKINRVFAAKNTDYELFKKRADGGLVKFADAPSKMYVFNDDLKKFDNFKDVVDLQWYYDLANKVYERWKV